MTDSHGGQDTDQVAVTVDAPQQPTLLTFLTRPGDLAVRVDGKRRVDGWQRRFAVGELLQVAAPRRQRYDGVLYEFVRWSDGGARVHEIVVPENRSRFRAVYRRVQA